MHCSKFILLKLALYLTHMLIEHVFLINSPRCYGDCRLDNFWGKRPLGILDLGDSGLQSCQQVYTASESIYGSGKLVLLVVILKLPSLHISQNTL